MKKRIAILLVLALVLALSGCKSSDYKQAVTAMDAGNYQEALTALDALGDYKDAADLAVKCRYAIAEDNFDKGEYETALTQFTDLGDYRDSGKYVTKCNYALAVKAFEDEDYTKAQDLFTGLADYQDSESYLEKTENALLLQAVSGTWKSGTFDLFGYLVDSMGLMENAWNTVTSDGTLPQANASFTVTIDENGEYGVECTIERSENFSEVFKDGPVHERSRQHQSGCPGLYAGRPVCGAGYRGLGRGHKQPVRHEHGRVPEKSGGHGGCAGCHRNGRL